jgi:hypothetical protein
MPETPEQDGGLSERLLGRGVNVGVVDVGWAQRQYARSADFVAERFGVLGDLNARYGTVDSRGAGTSSALPVAHGTYARAQSETPAGVGDLTTTGGGRIQRAAEVSAPRAGEGGSSSAAFVGGTGPTLQRKAAGPEPAHAPAEPAPAEPAPAEPAPTGEPAAAPSEKSAPLVSKESAPTTPAAPPSVMRLASETPRARGGDAGASGEGPAMTLADAPRESSGDVTREVSGDAPPASPASTVQTLARELTQPAVTGHDALIQRKPAPTSGPAAEPSGAETSTSTEPPRLPLAREEVTRATNESAPTVMRAARGPESATPIQRSAAVKEDSASRGVETTFAAPETAFAAPDSAAAPFSAPFAATHGGAELSTAGRATVQRAAVHASESPTRTRLSAPEIQRAASLPLAPRMVLRKAVGGSALSAGGPSASRASMPYVTQTTTPAADALTIQRADDGADGGGPQSAPVAHAPSNGGGVNLEQITEHVSRVILRRIAVERERRGVRRWL